jgi:outer membrane protein TolC
MCFTFISCTLTILDIFFTDDTGMNAPLTTPPTQRARGAKADDAAQAMATLPQREPAVVEAAEKVDSAEEEVKTAKKDIQSAEKKRDIAKVEVTAAKKDVADQKKTNTNLAKAEVNLAEAKLNYAKLIGVGADDVSIKTLIDQHRIAVKAWGNLVDPPSAVASTTPSVGNGKIDNHFRYFILFEMFF